MMDNIVTNFKGILKRSMMVLVLFVSITASVSAQSYTSRAEALVRIEAKATQVQSSISSLPTTSLDYRYGTLQVYTFKAIYEQLQSTPASVKEAVERVFATLDSRIDSTVEYYATMVEYNKKNKISGFDTYQAIKVEVKELLK